MNKLKQLSILVLFIVCCSKENPVLEVNPQVDAYQFKFMDYPNNVMPDYENNGIVTIRHQDGKIVKRQGGTFEINPATGYNCKFSMKVQDTLIYQNNKIKVNKRLIDKSDVYFMKDLFITLDNNGRMIEKIRALHPENISYQRDTLQYLYSTNGKISRINGKHENQVSISLFYYNEIDNLDSVVTKYTDRIDGELYQFRTDYFSEYDTSKNPLKELAIFDETFYRSLSANNFSYWRIKIRNDYDTGFHEEFRKYTLKYDNVGNVLFDEP
jgi:hypothetical protein